MDEEDDEDDDELEFTGCEYITGYYVLLSLTKIQLQTVLHWAFQREKEPKRNVLTNAN